MSTKCKLRDIPSDNEATTSNDSDNKKRLFEKFLNRCKNKSRKKQTNSLVKEARQLSDEIQHEESSSSSREKFGSGKKRRKRASKEEQLDQKILHPLISHQKKKKDENPLKRNYQTCRDWILPTRLVPSWHSQVR